MSEESEGVLMECIERGSGRSLFPARSTEGREGVWIRECQKSQRVYYEGVLLIACVERSDKSTCTIIK